MTAVCKFIAFLVLTMVIKTFGLYNAARFKPAIQSSTFDNCFAFLGVDANYNPYMGNGHCHHTLCEVIPWWMVDLRGQFVIEKIQLTNRQDSTYFANLLRNFDIDIFEQDPRQLANFPNITGQVCYHQTDPLGASTFNFTCSVPIVGRFVRLVMRLGSCDFLHTCETEVFVSGSSKEEIDFKKQINMALTGTPMATLITSDYFVCAQACLSRRSTDFCTAFNWITSTRSCQLFSVNPFLDLSANLTYNPGTYFSVQST
ncbi:fucolectin-7 [Biomphalaria glabrata]|nr:fucolectin-7 [Biomphalaria glabrata]